MSHMNNMTILIQEQEVIIYDLQKQLAKLESVLPTIVMTAFASIPDAVRAVKAGAITCLEKTCSEHDLWHAIKDALNENVTLL